MADKNNQEGQRTPEDLVVRGLRQLAIDPNEEVPADFHRQVMDRAAAMPLPRPRRWAWRRIGGPGWVLPALATCLMLSLAVNIWLGERLSGHAGLTNRSGRIRLAFADDAREQDVRTLLLTFGATIIGGPSPQGIYVVQVPLLPQLRSSEDPLHMLLEELRAHPAVRLAEPMAPD